MRTYTAVFNSGRKKKFEVGGVNFSLGQEELAIKVAQELYTVSGLDYVLSPSGRTIKVDGVEDKVEDNDPLLRTWVATFNSGRTQEFQSKCMSGGDNACQICAKADADQFVTSSGLKSIALLDGYVATFNSGRTEKITAVDDNEAIKVAKNMFTFSGLQSVRSSDGYVLTLPPAEGRNPSLGAAGPATSSIPLTVAAALAIAQAVSLVEDEELYEAANVLRGPVFNNNPGATDFVHLLDTEINEDERENEREERIETVKIDLQRLLDASDLQNDDPDLADRIGNAIWS